MNIIYLVARFHFLKFNINARETLVYSEGNWKSAFVKIENWNLLEPMIAENWKIENKIIFPNKVFPPSSFEEKAADMFWSVKNPLKKASKISCPRKRKISISASF